MINNKEILIQALETYATGTIEKLFGISSLPSQALIRYGVRNVMDKYGVFLDFLTSKDGSLNVPLIFNALLGELKARGGFEVWNIRFTEKDIDSLKDIYQELLENSKK